MTIDDKDRIKEWKPSVQFTIGMAGFHFFISKYFPFRWEGWNNHSVVRMLP